MSTNLPLVTPYSLIFNTADEVTLGQIAEDLQQAEDIELIFGHGLATALGTAFLSVEDPDDSPAKPLLALAMPAISMEIKRRGGNPDQLNIEATFEGCLQQMELGSPTLFSISPGGLEEMIRQIDVALFHIGDQVGMDEGTARLVFMKSRKAMVSLLSQINGQPAKGFGGQFQA